MPLSPDIKARLSAHFNRKLPGILTDLERTHGALAQGQRDAWEHARHVAHQLAGTAASFGWPTVTTAAQAVQLADEHTGLRPLWVLIEEVRDAVQQCEQQAPSSLPRKSE